MGMKRPAPIGKDVVPGRFDEEKIFHLLYFLRLFGGEIVPLGPVILQVVEFPSIVLRIPFIDAAGSPGTQGRRGPMAPAIHPS